MLRLIALIFVFAAAYAAPPAFADTLLIEAAGNSQAMSAPKRGMSMASVESTFGPPSSRRAAIGDPPITRWVYVDFIVYFEYDHVIHAVARRTAK